MNFKFFFIFSFFILTYSSCKSNHKKVISFSCINCKGCVQKTFEQIKIKRLYENYSIVLDKDCFPNFDALYSFPVIHKKQNEIFNEFGRFGNFVLFNSKGERIEFKTDMDLIDFIEN